MNVGEKKPYLPVFVGSTLADLQLYRRAVRDALGDFRKRFYCDRVSMPNTPRDIGSPHSFGRSYCGPARLDTGFSSVS